MKTLYLGACFKIAIIAIAKIAIKFKIAIIIIIIIIIIIDSELTCNWMSYLMSYLRILTQFIR